APAESRAPPPRRSRSRGISKGSRGSGRRPRTSREKRRGGWARSASLIPGEGRPAFDLRGQETILLAQFLQLGLQPADRRPRLGERGRVGALALQLHDAVAQHADHRRIPSARHLGELLHEVRLHLGDLHPVSLGLAGETLLEEGDAHFRLARTGRERRADERPQARRGRGRRRRFRFAGSWFFLAGARVGERQGLLLQLERQLLDLPAGTLQLLAQAPVFGEEPLVLVRRSGVAALFHRCTFRYGEPFYHGGSDRCPATCACIPKSPWNWRNSPRPTCTRRARRAWRSTTTRSARRRARPSVRRERPSSSPTSAAASTPRPSAHGCSSRFPTRASRSSRSTKSRGPRPGSSISTRCGCGRTSGWSRPGSVPPRAPTPSSSSPAWPSARGPTNPPPSASTSSPISCGREGASSTSAAE